MSNRSLKNENRPGLADEISRPPLTLKELRERVKHIAGLCWGLSIDLQNEIERNAAITAEFKRLEAENAEINGQLSEALKELKKCKNLAAQNAGLELENERLKAAVAMDQEKRKRAESNAHAAQLAWERRTYGNTTSELTNGHKRKETPPKPVKERKPKPKAEKPVPERTRKLNEKLAAMTPEEREKFERRLKAKRESQARYMAKKRAAQLQGGNDGSN